MSNALAIAAVTATLRDVLLPVAQAAVAGAEVRFLRPDNASGLPAQGVNIFLYQVTANAAWRNADLPTRRGDGQLLRRPQAALDLHYLISFYGDDADLEPQRLLGAVVRTLHAQPELSRDAVRTSTQTFTGSGAGGGGALPLADADLHDQVDLVRLAPAHLSLEETSKLWSVFFQTRYALSVSYVATVVLIETDVPPPPAPLPVRKPVVHAVPFDVPRIDAVEPAALDFASPPASMRLALVGRNLAAAGGVVRFAAADGRTLGDGTVEPGGADERLLVTPPAGLPAGVNVVRVVRAAPLDDPHVSARSEAAFFVVRPRFQGLAADPGGGGGGGGGGGPSAARRQVLVQPPPAADQRVSLVLASQPGAAPPPRTFNLPALRRALDADPVVVDVGGVPPGTYLARVAVAGAESALEGGGAGPFTGPLVTLP